MTIISNSLANGKRFHHNEVAEASGGTIGYQNMGRSGPSLSLALPADDDDPKARNWRISIDERDLTAIIRRVTHPDYTALFVFHDGDMSRLENDAPYRFHRRVLEANGLFMTKWRYVDGRAVYYVMALNVRHAQHQIKRMTKGRDVPIDAIVEYE